MGSATELWQELAEGVFRRRYEFLDQNIGAVFGAEAVLIIDSRANPTQAHEIRRDLARLTPLPVGWVFNTHYHWDHTFGNQAFPEAEMWGHRLCAEELVTRGEEMLAHVLEEWVPVAEHGPYREIVFTPPTHLFEQTARIDLGHRTVDLAYLGRGHTNNDAVLHTDGVTFAGDLIEEGDPPQFGDAFPLDWEETLGRLLSDCRQVVVPGHGDVVTVQYVAEAQQDLNWLAVLARQGFALGTPIHQIELLDAPYPVETCQKALARAYYELAGGDSSVKFSQ
jgi:glyoxylase-like metal-dependent hydrolase (beta-lactamase superfamily II)